MIVVDMSNKLGVWSIFLPSNEYENLSFREN